VVCMCINQCRYFFRLCWNFDLAHLMLNDPVL
jgi:hypothetical protein